MLSKIKISLTEKLLYLYIILVPVMRVPYFPFIGQKIQYSDIFFLILFFIWLTQLLKRTKKFLNVPLIVPLSGMLILFLFSFIHSEHWAISGIEYAGILYLAFLYILLCQLVDSQELWWRLIKCWCIVSLLIAVTGIVAYLLYFFYGINSFLMVNHNDFVNVDQHLVHRLSSIFRHPGMLVVYLHASIVFGFTLATRNKRSNESLLGYLVVAMCFVAAFFTKTRDIAGIAITLFIILIFIPKRNIFIFLGQHISLIFALVISIYAISLMIWWVFPVKFYRNSAQQKASIEFNTLHSTHFVRYKTQLRIMKDYPWVGVGLGMYNYKSADYIKWSDVKDTYHVEYPQIKEQDENRYKKGIDPHSLYLGFGAETGLLGLGGLLFFFLQMILQFMKKIKSENNIQVGYISLIFLAGLIGFLFNGMYFDMLSVRSFWFLMAMGVIYIQLFEQKKIV